MARGDGMIPVLLLLSCTDGKPAESSPPPMDSAGPDSTDTTHPTETATDSPPDSPTPPCDSADEVNWYPDADGDGFGVEEGAIRDCTQPEGYAAQAGDCDDAHVNAFPGNEDVWGDGVDGDCDGVDDCGDGVVWDGNVYFSEGAAPEEAAEFCKQYDIVTGMLSVYGTDWEDLSGLDCVCGVGDLRVWYNMNLRSLNGLEGLRSVVTNPDSSVFGISIYYDPELDNLEALGGIQYFDGGIDVAGVGPTDLSGLQWMEDIPAVYVGGGPVSLYGARNLRRVESLSLDLFRDMTTLDGLGSLEWVGEYGMYLHALLSLTSFAELRSLTEVDGRVSLDTNDTLIAMTEFPPLSAIGGEFEIADYSALETLDGLDALEEVGGSLVLYRDDALVSLRGLEGLRRIEGNLELRELDSLEDISALYGVEYVGGCIRIESDRSLPEDAYDDLVTAIGEENIGGICL